MEKIIKKSDAIALVDKMLQNADIEIKLFDGGDRNCVFKLEIDESSDASCIVYAKNTINKAVCRECLPLLFVAEIIWLNRKLINNSGQLSAI